MAKDPKSKRSPQKKGEEFAELYHDDVEFDEEDFVEEEDPELLDEAEVVEWDEEDDDTEYEKSRSRREERSEDRPPPTSKIGKLRERMRPHPVRPGEQDPLQSPVVLGLFGGTLVLLLVAGILWFIIGRQSSQKAFDAAQEKLDTGQYSQAIQLFEKFQDTYPTHKLLPQARIGQGKAAILQHITGGSPDWPKGLEELQNFIRNFKDQEEFEELKPELRRYAEEIAVGSAKTAAQARERSLLKIPPQALVVAQRYTPEEEEADKLEAEVERLLVVANDAIVKQETYDAAVARIEQALNSKPPRTLDAMHAREGLLDRYPDVQSNPKVRLLLRQTLTAEQNLVHPEKRELAVTEEDHPGLAQPPVTLITLSRTRSDVESANTTIFGLSKGCLFGVDATTGEPLWRRSVGLDTPFFPLRVNTKSPGVLIFDTNRRELVALNERTGELIWRLPLNDQLTGPPLEHNNILYLASTTNRLYKVDVGSGTPMGVLHFAQNLLAPVLPAPDGNHLIAVGNQEMVYTIDARDFRCVGVSHVGHKRGTASVDAPLIDLGSLILLAENDRSDSCLLRVFRMGKPNEQIVEVETHRISGQVRDTPVLRGNQLYVPSSGERFTVFAVSDDPNLDSDPEKFALTKLSTQKLQTPHEGPMHMLALEGQVWLATSALRKMENNSGTTNIVGEPMAVGVSAQPIQQRGDNLYVARHRPYSSSSLMIQFQIDTQRTNWGLTMGSKILAASGNAQALVAANEDGYIYRLTEADFSPSMASAEFKTSPRETLSLPRDLQSPLGAIRLQDGSLFVYAGGDEPKAWFITPNGQLGRSASIPGALQTKPLALSDGVILPLENRLHYLPIKPGGPRVDDYTRKLEVNPDKSQRPSQWVHLERLGEQEILALDSGGVLTRIELRTDPSPHLFESGKLQLESPVAVPFAAFPDFIVFADTSRQLHVMDAQTFQIVGSAKLDGNATNAVWMVDGTVFVETNRSELQAFKITPVPKKMWSLSLQGSGLAGSPVVRGGRLVVTTQNGEILIVDPNTGEARQRHFLGQALADSPLLFGTHLLVPSLDGSLYPLESLLTGGQ